MLQLEALDGAQELGGHVGVGVDGGALNGARPLAVGLAAQLPELRLFAGGHEEAVVADAHPGAFVVAVAAAAFVDGVAQPVGGAGHGKEVVALLYECGLAALAVEQEAGEGYGGGNAKFCLLGRHTPPLRR